VISLKLFKKMTTQEIADRLHELCKNGKFEQARQELYSPQAESIEGEQAPEPRRIQGIEQINQKNEQFQNDVEQMHNVNVTKPIVQGNLISMGLGMDVTMKNRGRTNMEEMCVYQVKDGKIVKEQFIS